jgi:hypothetical protein
MSCDHSFVLEMIQGSIWSQTIDEGCTELRATTEQCSTEITDLVQEQIADLEGESEAITLSAGEKLASLEDRFDGLA